MKKLSLLIASALASSQSLALTMFDDVDLYETSDMYHSLQGDGIAVVKGSCCTGALIDPYFVITANHVSSSTWSATKYKEVSEGFYNTEAQQKAVIDLDNDPWGQNKFVVKNKNGSGEDMAVFRLSNPFTIINPVEIYDFKKFGYDLGGKTGYVASRSGDYKLMGTFTYRTDKNYDGFPRISWMDYDLTPHIPKTKFETEVRSGDSGSGIYIYRDGKWYLTGNVAMRWAAGWKQGSNGVSAAHYRDQIMQIMQDNAR